MGRVLAARSVPALIVLALAACAPTPAAAPPAPPPATGGPAAPATPPARIAVHFDGVEQAIAARQETLRSEEARSENPRFGAPAEGVSAFGGAGEEMEEEVLEDGGPATGGLGGRAAPRPAPTAPPAAEAPAPMLDMDGADDDGDHYDEAANSDEDAAVATTWRRSSAEPNASRLAVGEGAYLPLEALQIQVRVDGFRARYVLDYLYRNPHDRRLEGTFSLRLPGDASPDYLAFGKTVLKDDRTPPPVLALPETPAAWIRPDAIRTARRETWTEPREARVVPRELAARAYTETVAREVDPALLEWSGAGVFSARVFPLEPQTLHRIVVAYDVNLTALDGGHELRIDVPEGVPRLAMSIDAANRTGHDVSLKCSTEVRAVTVPGRIHYTFEDPEPGTVTVRLTGSTPLALTGTDETGDYFAATFRPEIPREAQEADAAGTGKAVFVLDTSNSSRAERMNIWLDILAAILTENRADIREFAVLCFDVQQHWWREEWTRNDEQAVARFTQYARTLSLEGATDLAAALQAAARPAPSWSGSQPFDLFLLSDGGATWGETGHADLAAELAAPQVRALFAYDTGQQGTDLRTLSALAQSTGGAVFSVPGESEVKAAATAHRSRPWRVERVGVEGCSDVLLAGRPVVIYPGQTLIATGRGTPAAGVELVLDLAQHAATHQVRVPLSEPVASPLAPRVFGQIAVGQLEQLGDLAREATIPHARHFRVVGTTCSLVMLESEEDYERYGIDSAGDADIVRDSRVDETVRLLLAEAQRRIQVPKARFQGWLERMARTGGLRLDGPSRVRERIEAAPTSWFDRPQRTLACEALRWSDIPGPFHEELATGEPGYDAVVTEAGRRGGPDALRALSTLVEASPGDIPLVRDVAYAALTSGQSAHATSLFRRAATLRPFEPHGFLAMAECLNTTGRPDLAAALIDATLDGEWPGRFGNWPSLARRLRRALPAVDDVLSGDWQTAFDEPGDLFVGIEWNTDRTDVDLHVLDPSGEVCYYSHPETKMGGRLSTDVTQGYGPELFVLRNAQPGEYLIAVKYFAGDRLRTGVRTKVRVTIVTEAGTDRERLLRKTVTLGDADQFHGVARVVVSGAAGDAGANGE